MNFDDTNPIEYTVTDVENTLDQFSLERPVTRSVVMEAPAISQHPWHSAEMHQDFDFSHQSNKTSSTDKLSVRPNLTYVVQNQMISSLPAAPFYIEPYTTFRSALAAHQILTILESAFSKANIDYEINTQKYKIKGCSYSQTGQVVHFKVRLYQTTDSSSEILVEFQRRRGCVVHFNQLYYETSQQLTNRVSTPTNLQALDIEPNTEDVSRSAALLMDMAMCDQVDIQREGASGLASLCTSKQAVATVLSTINLSNLSKLLQSPDEDVVRNTAAFLYSLLTFSTSEQFQKSIVPSLFTSLQTPLTIWNTDAKRFLSAAIAEIATSGSVNLSPFRSVLSQFSQCKDERLNHNISTAMNAITTH